MTLTPSYGETPIDWDEWDALIPEKREEFKIMPLRSEIYDLETAIADEITEAYISKTLAGEITLESMFHPRFVKELHHDLYTEMWIWAGQIRRVALNIGAEIQPAYLESELINSLDGLHYRWTNTDDWDPRTLGIASHAELTRIHPFRDGNGRSSRLFADLVFLVTQETNDIFVYDWELGDGTKKQYVDLLRAYDEHRDPRDLTKFAPIRDF